MRVTKRITFTETESADEFIANDGSEIAFCGKGVRAWFDIPKDCKEFDLLISSQSLRNGYRVEFLNAQDQQAVSYNRFMPFEPQKLHTSKHSYSAPGLDADTDQLLFQFAKEFGDCYVAVES